MLKSWLVLENKMSFNVLFQVSLNAMWDFYVETTFQFNKQYQKTMNKKSILKEVVWQHLEYLNFFMGKKKSFES